MPIIIQFVNTESSLFSWWNHARPIRSDMEPTEAPQPQKKHSNMLRIRGGAPTGGDKEHPIDKYSATVPKLTTAGFMWDGLLK